MKPGGDDDDGGCRCRRRSRALRRDRVHGEYYHTTFRRAARAVDCRLDPLETHEVRTSDGGYLLDLFQDVVAEVRVRAV